jgi:shikimate kinase
MKYDKVFLIGFMGCGKSTFGRKLAEELNWDFVDLDDYIEFQEKSSIPEIFRDKGEAYFRSLESKAVEESSKWKRTIISTGGGTPCFNDNISSINNIGLSVYIKLSPEVLKSRLEGEKFKRPLIANLSDIEMLSFIQLKLSDRSSDYSKSKIVFEYSDAGEVEFVASLKSNLAL